MDIDPAAFDDMIRTIDENIASLPEALSYIAVSRYTPAGAYELRRDDRGRLYALVGEEAIARLESAPPQLVSPPAYYGIPIIRLTEAA